jgi:hypothetical protein
MALCVLALLVGVVGCDKSQPVVALPDLPVEQRQANAKQGAEAVGAATASGDYAAVVDATYPPVIQLAGGRERMLKTMSGPAAQSADQEFKITGTTMGDVKQEVKDGSRFYAVINGRMRMTGPRGVLLSSIQTLGISEDGGRTWKYIAVVNPDDVRRVIPTLSASLELRKQGPPTFFASE